MTARLSHEQVRWIIDNHWAKPMSPKWMDDAASEIIALANDPSLDRRPSRSEALALCSYDDAHPARSESSEQWLLAETGLIDRLEAAGYLRPEPVVVPEWEPTEHEIWRMSEVLGCDKDSARAYLIAIYDEGMMIVPRDAAGQEQEGGNAGNTAVVCKDDTTLQETCRLCSGEGGWYAFNQDGDELWAECDDCNGTGRIPHPEGDVKGGE